MQTFKASELRVYDLPGETPYMEELMELSIDLSVERRK